MKKIPLFVAIVACGAIALAAHQPVSRTADRMAVDQASAGQDQSGQQAAVNVAGKWIMTLEMAMGTATPALDLKQDGEKITGAYTGRYGTFPLEGSLKGRSLVFAFAMTAEGQSVTMTFQAEVAADGQSMKGTATLGEMGDATWSAKRQ